MRDTKYLAWHLEKKTMGIVTDIHWTDHKIAWVSLTYVDGSGDTHVPISKVELRAYTGFKDKNRKEVYDGDIVGKFSDKDNTDYDNKPSKWLQVVKWDEESCTWRIWDQEVKTSFELMYASGFDGDILSLDMLENPKVIGNIYENGDLPEVEVA